MQRAVCERCGQRQPKGWSGGHLCLACGAAVRRELRCAWCAQWVPAGKFCRECGCELVGEADYGAARMLKDAGVDRLSLAQKLRELDPDQIQNYARLYETQLAAVIRRVEEIRLCEEYLLQKNYSTRLEEELIPLLPLNKKDLAALREGPSGPFEHRPELLSEIAEHSPIPMTRTLACIALLRQGNIPKKVFAAAQSALSSEDSDIAVEAALAFAHWRARLSPYRLWKRIDGLAYEGGGAWNGIDPYRLFEVAGRVPKGSPLWPWAAAAMALARFGEYGTVPVPSPDLSADEREYAELLRPALRDGLDSGDPDLRFTCAMALGEDELVARALDATDEPMRTVARTFLARHGSPAVGRCITDGSEEVRHEILEILPRPLPKALIEPVLRAVEIGGPEIRSTGAWLLQPDLTADTVHRLLGVAIREQDLAVFKTLLSAQPLPESRMVVRAIIEAGLFEALYGALVDAAWHFDFAAEAPVLLMKKGDAETLERLLAIAEKQLDWSFSQDSSSETTNQADRAVTQTALEAARFLVRIAFGDYPNEIRLRAYSRLEYLEYRDETRWSLMSPSAAKELFGRTSELLRAVSRVLRDPELHQMCISIVERLLKHFAELEPHLGEDPEALAGLTDALFCMIKEDFCGNTVLQAEVAKLLRAMAAAYPEPALGSVISLLHDHDALRRCRDLAASLLDDYSELIRPLRADKDLFGSFVEALLRILRAGRDLYHCQDTVAEILQWLAADAPACRGRIAEILTPMIADLDFLPGDEKKRLERLARAVGLDPEAVAGGNLATEDEIIVEEDQIAVDALDHEVLLPDEPLPTLAQYTEFLKAFSAASNPMDVLSRYGLSLDQYAQSVETWGRVLSSRDEVAIRYAQIMAGG